MGFGQHFFDSGAFTLEKHARKWAKETGNSKWDYFDLPESYAFLDSYAEFVKEHQLGIDHYANVDVIGNPELTYRNQRYLEERGLRPVPAIHYGTDVAWLKRYIDDGHDYVAVGGLIGRINKEATRSWLDQCFSMMCDSSGMPVIKCHGFGMTTFNAMLRYPWYSVDSTSWFRFAMMGLIFVPHSQHGQWDFTKSPFVIHVHSITKGAKSEASRVHQWLSDAGTTLDAVADIDDASGMKQRTLANTRFFHRFVNSLPTWPWVWSRKTGAAQFNI